MIHPIMAIGNGKEREFEGIESQLKRKDQLLEKKEDQNCLYSIALDLKNYMIDLDILEYTNGNI